MDTLMAVKNPKGEECQHRCCCGDRHVPPSFGRNASRLGTISDAQHILYRVSFHLHRLMMSQRTNMDAKGTWLRRGDPAELQQHGQTLYRRGEYKKALESFSQVILSIAGMTSMHAYIHAIQALKMKPSDPVGILDNRAATYCKLENFDLALRDAKQMIKTDRCDERVNISFLSFCFENCLLRKRSGIPAICQDPPPEQEA